MIRLNKFIIAGMLMLGMQAAMVRAEESAAPKPPDLTAGGVRNSADGDWSILSMWPQHGGVRGWFHQPSTEARQILVTKVTPDCAWAGLLETNDVILGVNGKLFDADARRLLWRATRDAEEGMGGSVISLIRWRAGKTDTVAVDVSNVPPPPDLIAGGTKDKTHDWLLGPTGLRGWLFTRKGRSTAARQILVTAVDKGSPADGIVAVGDVILGAGGKLFDGDARIQFGNAITAAETEKGGGVLRLTRWRAGPSTSLRAGQTANVELKLQVLGSYSTTAPYDCPKSQAIFAQGCRLIAQREDRFAPKGGYGEGMPGMLNALALLASGKAEYRPLLAAHARKVASAMKDVQNFHGWGSSYGNLFLAEYVLATGDQEMLAELKRTSMIAVAAQSTYGTWGHGGRLPDGHCSGYGPMNQVGLPMTLSMVLARQAGVKDPALDKAIDKSVAFLRTYVNRGAIPYGDHLPGAGHEDNGKCSLAAVLFDVLGDPEATGFYARMATAAYDEREQGHCGNWFNMMWALPGVSRCGPLATGAYLKEQSWYYDLARNWKGGFEYQQVDAGEENNNYTGWDLTGTYLIAFGLPLKSLAVMGKKTCTVPPLTGSEVASVIAAGRDAYPINGRNGYGERTSEELLAGLASWSPALRKRSAKALARREGEFVPALLKLLSGSDRYARYGACEALGCLGPRADAAAPQLRAMLKDPDPWLQSLACLALPNLGEAARRESVADLLRLAATPNPADPRQTVQRAVGIALFSPYPGNREPASILTGPLEGVDRSLLYPAVRALLQNDDSVARGGAAAIYDRLSERDLAALLPAIVKAGQERAPSNEMFAQGPLLAAYDLLSRLHIREGMTMCEAVLTEGWGGDGQPKSLEFLSRYGVHAKEILPRLKGIEMIRRRWGPQVEAIEKATESPTLVSLQEFIKQAAAGGSGSAGARKVKP
jgi:hypothetical protein